MDITTRNSERKDT